MNVNVVQARIDAGGLSDEGMAVIQRSQMLRDTLFLHRGVHQTMALLMALLDKAITYMADEKCGKGTDICSPQFDTADYVLIQAIILYLGCSALIMLDPDNPASNILLWSPRQPANNNDAFRLMRNIMGGSAVFREDAGLTSRGFAQMTLLPLIQAYKKGKSLKNAMDARGEYVTAIISMLERVAQFEPDRVLDDTNILPQHTLRYAAFEETMAQVRPYDDDAMERIANALDNSGSRSTSAMLQSAVKTIGMLALSGAVGVGVGAYYGDDIKSFIPDINIHFRSTGEPSNGQGEQGAPKKE